MTALEYVNRILAPDTEENEAKALSGLIQSHMRLREANMEREARWRAMSRWKRWLIKKLDK